MTSTTLIFLLLDVVLLLLLALGYCFVYFSEREARLLDKIKAGKVQSGDEMQYALMLWLSEMGAARAMVSDDRARCRSIDRDEFDRALYRRLLHYDDVGSMRAMVDTRLAGYATRLRKDFPELTDKEEVLLYLYLLRLDDATICLLGEYSPNSLPKIKNRLCKKVGLESAAELRSYLQERMSL